MPTMTPAPMRLSRRIRSLTTTPEPTATPEQVPLPLLQLGHQLLQLRQWLLPHRHPGDRQNPVQFGTEVAADDHYRRDTVSDGSSWLSQLNDPPEEGFRFIL